MKTFSNVFVLFTLFHRIEIADSDMKEVNIANNNSAPLALYQKNNEEMVLARPYSNLEDQNTVTFVYDNIDNTENFVLACSAQTSGQLEQQTQWNDRKARGLNEINEILLFPGVRINCEKEIIPTISKDEHLQGCHRISEDQTKGYMYGVGYLVWNTNKQNVEFVTIYRFCYTEEDGTLYTVHRIRTPHLLKFKNYYMTNVVYRSVLDMNIEKTLWEEHGEHYLKHQLVSHYDMAVHSWKKTTLFSFNYIQLKSCQMKRYFNTIDNYVRYFAQKKSIELTIYSGTYSKKISEEVWDILFGHRRKYAPVTDEFIWKVIHDDEYNTVVVITHLPPHEHCNFICAYNPVTLDDSEQGCTYTCQVDKTLLSNFGLEDFKSNGFLIFDLPSVAKSNEEIPNDDGPKGSRSLLNTVNISSFLKTYLGFQAAISAYEAGEPIVIEDSKPDSMCILQ